MKFVTPLMEAEQLTLLEARDQGPTAALRRRAQAVELSSRGYRRTAIADLLNVHGETVSGWLDLWDTQGIRGLYDQPRGGRPADRHATGVDLSMSRSCCATATTR